MAASLIVCGLVGYKSRVDSSSMFGANRKFVEEAVARKVQEYQNNTDLMDISSLCETREVTRRENLQKGGFCSTKFC